MSDDSGAVAWLPVLRDAVQQQVMLRGYSLFIQADPRTEFTIHVLPPTDLEDAFRRELARLQSEVRGLREALGKIAFAAHGQNQVVHEATAALWLAVVAEYERIANAALKEPSDGK